MEWKFSIKASQRMRAAGFTPDDMLGAIPSFLSDDDPRGAVDQIDAAYKQYGGWHDSEGWSIYEGSDGLTARYPGDPLRFLIAETKLRDERILFFNGAYIAVIQPDGSHRMARID